MLFIRSQYHLTSDIYDLLQVWNTKINFSLYYSTEVISGGGGGGGNL